MLGVASVALRAAGCTWLKPAAQLIGRWTLDEASGATATDEAGHNDGTYGNVALQQDPLVEGDPGTSVRFFGNSHVAVLHVAAYEVESYSVVVYGQVQSGPGPGANAILIQKDRPGLPGGFHVGIVNAGGTLRPQVYTKDASGNAVWVGSSDGIGQVAPGTAFMLVMTCGRGGGTRVWLDKVEIGSTNNHVGLFSNDEQIGIGRYRPDISSTAGFNGWIDEVRLYVGELTQDEVNALADAQDLVVPPAEEGAFTVPAIPNEPAGTTIRYVAGTDAIGGTCSNGNNGSIGAPWLTLAFAIANTPNSTNTTIVLRSGAIYREAGLSPGSRRIMGYNQDIDDDPLDSSNWPILDGGIDMSGVTWELIDSGRQEYRTQQTVGSMGLTGTQINCFVYPGTDAYQIPRWEPLNGIIEPQKGVLLYPYINSNANDDWSLNCFRHTGAHSGTIEQRTYYYGPGVCVIGDRVHIRLQPVHNNVNGGVHGDDFGGDHNPANHSVFLWSDNRNLFSSVGAGFRLEGVFARNYDRIAGSAISANNVSMSRNVFWGSDQQDHAMTVQGSGIDFLFQHNVAVPGLQDSHQFSIGKHPPYWDTWGANMGRAGYPGFVGGSGNVRILDNLILRTFDTAAGDTDVGMNLEIAYNAIDVYDDNTQCHNSTSEHIHHNFIIGPLFGAGGDTPPPGNRHDIHHNVAIVTKYHLYQATRPYTWKVRTPHSSQNGRNHTIAHNTIIMGQPRMEGSSNYGSEVSGDGLQDPQSPEFQDVFNNIFVVVNRISPTGFVPPFRNFHGRVNCGSTSQRNRLDGNAYFKLDLDGLSGGNLFQTFRHGDGSNAVNFATLAAFKASSHFTQSKNIYSPGYENSGFESNPQFAGGNSILHETGTKPFHETPLSAYIPQNASFASAQRRSEDSPHRRPRMAGVKGVGCAPPGADDSFVCSGALVARSTSAAAASTWDCRATPTRHGAAHSTRTATGPRSGRERHDGRN